MPPIPPGQVIMMQGHGNMGTALAATWFWNPDGLLDSRPLRNNPNPWTDPWGAVWGAGQFAFIGINKTSQPARLRVLDGLGLFLRSIAMPANSNVTRNAAQLVLGGLFLDARDFNGASIEML
jgi:hypothetical protein